MNKQGEQRIREIVREEIEKEKAANIATLKEIYERLGKSHIPRNPWGITPLGRYLPSSESIETMDNDRFENWIYLAYEIIYARKKARDPLFQLKKRISQIVAQELPEEEKEDRVYEEIILYLSLKAQN